jgi:hypothetical protein
VPWRPNLLPSPSDGLTSGRHFGSGRSRARHHPSPVASWRTLVRANYAIAAGVGKLIILYRPPTTYRFGKQLLPADLVGLVTIDYLPRVWSAARALLSPPA